jgi:hypothetical protein
MKLSLVCTSTLHIEAGRLAIFYGETALESVYDSATAEQVLHRSQVCVARPLRPAIPLEVGPFGRNHRPASVGKDQNQLEASLTMRVTENGERLTLKWMLWTVDCDVLEMGSVWMVPSITSLTKS